MVHLAVFASGQGSNLAAISDDIRSGRLRGVEISLVVSNNSKSGALDYARSHHFAAKHISLVKSGGDEAQVAAEMVSALSEAKVDLIVLAGYLKKLPASVIEKYHHRILNVHPALLPEFGGAGMYGMNVHTAVLSAGKSESGATVHIVEGEYDTGNIILQESCPVYQTDTPDILAKRIRKIEHRILPKAIQMIADTIENDRQNKN